MSFHKITAKLFLVISLSVTVLLIGTTMWISYYFRGILLQRSQENQVTMAAQASVNIDNILSELKQMVYYLSCDKMIPQIVEEPQEGIASANLSRELTSRFYTYTSASITPAHIDYNSFLFVSDQLPISQSLAPCLLDQLQNGNACVGSAVQVENEEWYHRTLEQSGDMVSFVFPEIPGYIYFTNLQRNINLSDPDYNDEIGVVAFAVKQRYIVDFLKLARLTSGSDAIFLYGDTVMCSTNEERYTAGEELSRIAPELLAEESGRESREVKLFGEVCRVVREPVFNDWSIVLATPRSEILNDMNHILRIVWLELAAGVILAILLSRVVSFRFTRPIVRLSDTMRKMDSEEKLTHIPQQTYPDDEVGILYQSFQRMQISLKRLFREKEESMIAQNESRLHILQLQINPHFIYNTLDTINCIALSEGQENISEIASALIGILRYSIRYMKENSTVGLELSYLQNYVKIQQLRFSSPFEFICDVDPEDYGQEIPQMSLQPLVENALFHGEPAEGNLKIHVYARKEPGCFRICVEDNGTKGDAAVLNRFLEGKAQVKTKGEGIGIRNVDERIRMQFGTGSGLQFEQDVAGMRAVITLVNRGPAEE